MSTSQRKEKQIADDIDTLPEETIVKEEEKKTFGRYVNPQISQILQVPEGTVKSRMNKAKLLLKKELEALGYDR